jgi:hypothetical protein
MEGDAAAWDARVNAGAKLHRLYENPSFGTAINSKCGSHPPAQHKVAQITMLEIRAFGQLRTCISSVRFVVHPV